ncbi:UDP-galactose transporter [Drechslerella dactyloides]|uniref:UDP-galactose transporter n=1 Tax=Drechslerella dactyloides TaxID=74499 RepID=A0AAD6IWH6_DREDA|nr:UDP-galactose transporter [Drechslerella dactyloides]
MVIMHYSRIMPSTPGGRYLTSTAVFMNEVIKFLICSLIAFQDQTAKDGPHTSWLVTGTTVYNEVFKHDSWKLAIPAALYTLQNSLQYVAVSNLDAATFQVTYQLKILTTALFSVSLLGRKLSPRRWVSLILLTAGVAIVQLPSPSPDAAEHTTKSAIRAIRDVITGRSASYDGIHKDNDDSLQMNRSVGLMAVVIACTISGLAGVYFEKVLKGTSATLWVRNVQLSFYSLFPAFFIGVAWKDGAEIAKKGFFNGYNGVVWTAIAFQALGGIVVALCVNYADNIAKNFATSISILLSCIASIYFFDFVVSVQFLIGSTIVLFATYLYSRADSEKPVAYAPLEKTTTEPIYPPEPKHRSERVNTLRMNLAPSTALGTASPVSERPRSPALFAKYAGEKRDD